MEILMYYLLIAIIAVLSLISYRLRTKAETQLGYVISVCIVAGIIGVTSVLTLRSERIEPIDAKLIDFTATSIKSYPAWEETTIVKKVNDTGTNILENITTKYPKSYALTYSNGLEKDIPKETYDYFKGLWGNTEKLTYKLDSSNLSRGHYVEMFWNRRNEDALIYTKTDLYINYLINIYEYSEINYMEAESLNLIPRDRNLIVNSNDVLEPRYKLVYGLDFSDELLRKLNVIASKIGVRPILLIWTGENNKIPINRQRDYWRGGKENEVVFCIGINNAEDREILWVDSFSWDEKNDFDESVIETAMAVGSRLDLDRVINAVIDAFKSNLWNPKLSKDYSLAKLPISKFHMSFTLLILILITLIVISSIYKKITKLRKETDGKSISNDKPNN